MSGDPLPIEIPRSLLEQTFKEARKSYPHECCGWLSGPREQNAATMLRACTNAQGEDHPTQPERGTETAYVIAGADLLELNRSLDGETPPKVLYHSHYNGRAYFSETDHAVATSPWGDGPMYPVQQLVVGLDSERVVEAALFAWSDAAQSFVEIARFEGAEL